MKTFTDRPITNLREECEHLAPLQSFDPEVFVGEDEASQTVCNFVLALAVVFNDCKDSILAYECLIGQRPEGEFTPTPEWGTYSAIEQHILRQQVALLHRLLELINTNVSVIDHPLFRKVIRALHPRSKKAWSSLVNVANGPKDNKTQDPVARFLRLIRHKVASHYDPKEIFRGYEQQFISQDGVVTTPLLSRGENMLETRFYFADGAAQSYLEFRLHEGGKKQTKPEEVADIVNNLSLSLIQIVGKFINLRSPFRRYTPDTK